MPPGVVVNDPREGGTHGCETQPISGGDDAESEPPFFRGEPPLNHGQDRSPHASGSNAHNSIEEAGRPELVDGAHEKDPDPENQGAGGDDAPGAQSVSEVAAERS